MVWGLGCRVLGCRGCREFRDVGVWGGLGVFGFSGFGIRRFARSCLDFACPVEANPAPVTRPTSLFRSRSMSTAAGRQGEGRELGSKGSFMGRFYGFLRSLKGSDVWALGLYRVHRVCPLSPT